MLLKEGVGCRLRDTITATHLSMKFLTVSAAAALHTALNIANNMPTTTLSVLKLQSPMNYSQHAELTCFLSNSVTLRSSSARICLSSLLSRSSSCLSGSELELPRRVELGEPRNSDALSIRRPFSINHSFLGHLRSSFMSAAVFLTWSRLLQPTCPEHCLGALCKH